MTEKEKNETKLRIISDLFKKWGILDEDIANIKRKKYNKESSIKFLSSDEGNIDILTSGGSFYQNMLVRCRMYDPFNFQPSYHFFLFGKKVKKEKYGFFSRFLFN